MELVKELELFGLTNEFLQELVIESIEEIEFDLEGPRQDVGH